MHPEKVVIIIPTYNEEEVITETIKAISEIRNQAEGFDIHVLVFDSASTDDTQAIVVNLLKVYPWLHLETEPQKSGLGSAYIQAMKYALSRMQADIVIEFDADLSHQPKYIVPMLSKMNTHDVVLGSRYVVDGSIPNDWGMRRKLISIVGNQIARMILTGKYKDFTSGFRITRNFFLKNILEDDFISDHYAYKLQLLWMLHKNGAKICEHPIEFIDRTKGQSKLPANSITDSLRVLFLLRLKSIKSLVSRATAS
ncbi:MAG: polyprenol monophosphomannose synthase [Legionellaceae bacterium]|nr:polyprenol monophosphomannose synthase [Legionellaceae bacterium]